MRFESTQFAEEENVELNVIPLIDVLLVLLIFFILSTTFDQSRGISVKLPSARTGAQESAAKDFTISIDKANNLFLDGKKIDLASVQSQLQAAANGKPIQALIIRADESVTHGLVVHVMDEAKRAGVEKLSLATTTE